MWRAELWGTDPEVRIGKIDIRFQEKGYSRKDLAFKLAETMFEIIDAKAVKNLVRSEHASIEDVFQGDETPVEIANDDIPF